MVLHRPNIVSRSAWPQYGVKVKWSRKRIVTGVSLSLIVAAGHNAAHSDNRETGAWEAEEEEAL